MEGNPLSFTDPTGKFVWFAALPFVGGGSAGGLGTFVTLNAALGVGAWAIANSGESTQPSTGGSSGSLTKDQELERDADYQLYKWRCDRDKPPPGLDKCETAQWELDRAKQCKQQRERWDEKWYPVRHWSSIIQENNRIEKWTKVVAKECICP